MRKLPSRTVWIMAWGCFVCGWIVSGFAQDAKSNSNPGKLNDASLPMAAAGDEVVIKRDAVALIDPQKYRTSLSLSPVNAVTLVAPFDGFVRGLQVKAGQTLQAQAEVVRFDQSIQKLQHQRAQHLYKAATVEQKIVAASGGGEDQKELVQARVDAAKADLDLAQLQLEQSVVRMPFTGDVLRMLVSEGQFVRAGSPLAIAGDTTSLQVEIPAERSTVEKATTLKLKIEGQEVDAKIQTVLPLDTKFDSLRELFDSVASVVLVIDNSKKKFQAGQSVYVPLIPRHPVTEVPSSAIQNHDKGERKVQVLRHETVRDIPVVLLGSVGLDRLYVTGPFSVGDEVIYQASHQLMDGLPVKPTASKAKKADEANPAKPAANF